MSSMNYNNMSGFNNMNTSQANPLLRHPLPGLPRMPHGYPHNSSQHPMFPFMSQSQMPPVSQPLMYQHLQQSNDLSRQSPNQAEFMNVAPGQLPMNSAYVKDDDSLSTKSSSSGKYRATNEESLNSGLSGGYVDALDDFTPGSGADENFTKLLENLQVTDPSKVGWFLICSSFPASLI